MAVGDGVKTKWGYSGSTAFPCNAARYMRKSGYSMATRRWGLNKEMILEMLDNRRLVILAGKVFVMAIILRLFSIRVLLQKREMIRIPILIKTRILLSIHGFFR